MSSAKDSVQETYLKEAVDQKKPVRINLANGKEIRGVITSYDTFTLIVNVKEMGVLVYKSAIAAIGPAGSET